MVGASVRVTTSGAAGVDDGQVEHVIVDSARAVSWRAIEWVSGFVLVVDSGGCVMKERGGTGEEGGENDEFHGCGLLVWFVGCFGSLMM